MFPWSSRKTMVLIAITLLISFYIIFLVFPAFYAVYGSFSNWNPLNKELKFIGLENYIRAFSTREVFVALKNTILFTLIVSTLRAFFGLLIANAIVSVVWLKSFFRTVFFLPLITPLIAVSLLFTLIYEPTTGLLNSILELVGLQGLGWLKDKVLALPSVMLMQLWKDAGFAMILYLAGINAIPSSYFEAADMDGASELRKFISIKIPLVSNITLFILVTGAIGYLQVFTQIYMMTEGGPSNATLTVVYQIYKEAFVNYKFGYAAVITFILFFVILIFSLVQLKLIKTQELS